MNTTSTQCVNGLLQVGDLVISVPTDDYACLVGRIMQINLLGTPEHDAETENDTDDVHVCFMDFEYSTKRIKEIEAMFSDLYQMKKSFEECPLDDVIMAPDSLVRLTGISEERMRFLLASEVNAACYCYEVLKKMLEGAGSVGTLTHTDSASEVDEENNHLAMSGFSITRPIGGQEVKIELTMPETREVYLFQKNKYHVDDILMKLEEMEEDEELGKYTFDEISSNDELMDTILYNYEKNMDKYDMHWDDALYKAVHDAVSKATA